MNDEKSLTFGWSGSRDPVPDDAKAIYIEVTEPAEIAGQQIEANSLWAGDPRGVYDDVDTGVRMYTPEADASGMPVWAADWLRKQRRWPKYAPDPPTPKHPAPPKTTSVKYTLEVEFDLDSMSHYRRPDGDYYDDEGEPLTLESVSKELLDDMLDDMDAHVHITKQEIFVDVPHTEDHEKPLAVPNGTGVQWAVRE